METPTLGEARFASDRSHTVSDDLRIPERIEVGAEPSFEFELAGPRAKLSRRQVSRSDWMRIA